jgi:hypothetical protein
MGVKLVSQIKKKHRLTVFENRVLRRIFGSKSGNVRGGWRSCIMRSSIIRTLHHILLG